MKKLLSLLTVMGASSVALTGCFGSSSTNSDAGAGNITEGTPEAPGVDETPSEDPIYVEEGQDNNEHYYPVWDFGVDESEDVLAGLHEGNTLVWGGINYVVDAELNLTVTGGDTSEGELVIPSTIGTYDVTSISKQAFRDAGLTSVTLGGNIEEIGNNAFRGNSLTEVTLPASLKTIGLMSFTENNIVYITMLGNTEFDYNTFDLGVIIDKA